MAQLEQFFAYVKEIALNRSHYANQFEGSPVRIQIERRDMIITNEYDNPFIDPDILDQEFAEQLNTIPEYLLSMCKKYRMSQIIMKQIAQYQFLTGTITCFLTRNQITVNFYDCFNKQTEITTFTVTVI